MISISSMPRSGKMDHCRPLKKTRTENLLESIETGRKNVAYSVMEFKCNEVRLRHLREQSKVKKASKGVLYWMLRDIRVQDNWALLFAQRSAMEHNLPLHVCYCVPTQPSQPTLRHWNFLLGGLLDVEDHCTKLNINFHVIRALDTESSHAVLNFIQKHDIGFVIVDFLPLRVPTKWVEDLTKNLPEGVEISQVDAHNIIPCWYVSSKQEYSARTIRPKIQKNLNDFLTEFPPVVCHPHFTEHKFAGNNWETLRANTKIDTSVQELTWAKPGYEEAVKQLDSFLNERLRDYAMARNDPVKNTISKLSPWFHFGMISVQRCVLEVNKYKHLYPQSVSSFNEETIVRRELSDNYCFYNKNYDSICGASHWAIETLERHKLDKREHVYTLDLLEQARTHDALWNACQNQLVTYGKIHGYLRMYWGKKFLEYTKSPEQALEWAIFLNDRYSIDGTDPNGYVGCMWCICGLHDQGWKEREIFGKIRYMTFAGCRKKFDTDEFIAKWGKVKTV